MLPIPPVGLTFLNIGRVISWTAAAAAAAAIVAVAVVVVVLVHRSIFRVYGIFFFFAESQWIKCQLMVVQLIIRR